MPDLEIEEEEEEELNRRFKNLEGGNYEHLLKEGEELNRRFKNFLKSNKKAAEQSDEEEYSENQLKRKYNIERYASIIFITKNNIEELKEKLKQKDLANKYEIMKKIEKLNEYIKKI